jgi:predicted metal-dependent phosphoesterase TrpH
MFCARRLLLAFPFLLALSLALTQTRPSPDGGTGRWYKGNLHTHTLNSDGDSTPQEVATWYREHGYQFLALSDHNYLTDPAGLNAVLAGREKFLLLPAEEVTDAYLKKPIHINAYNLEREVQPMHGDSVSATIRNNVEAIRAVKGLPSVNHPNFHWAITAEDLLKIKNLRVFEVYNGHPTVNNVGGGGAMSLDEMWDVLLSAGQRLYGIAVDDAHVFKRTGQEFANPGRGWICVRAESLSAANIISAIEAGQFYASSGVQLTDIHVSNEEYSVEVKARETEKFTTYFIGNGGRVLAKSFDTISKYRFGGSEKYVRARIESSFGSTAWTQPVFRQQ